MTPDPIRRTYVCATFTADPIAEVIDFWHERLGMTDVVEIGPYNQVYQQILDPRSTLTRNTTGINLIWIRWEDLVPDAARLRTSSRGLWARAVRTAADELSAVVEKGVGRWQVPTWLVLGPSPADSTAAVDEVESFIRDRFAGRTGLHILFGNEIGARYPVSSWFDAEGERFGHVPYTRAAFAAVATAITRHRVALESTARKVIVLDCDQTIWRGVVGEDGVDGIRVDPPFAMLQRFMREQIELGRILCLSSKNDEDQVLEVFDRRRDMLLDWNQITAHRINWEPKHENIASLARELNLGLDSFIFVDDNPLECAAMRAHRPEVLTLELPADATSIPGYLEHVWALDPGPATEEDRSRTQAYRQQAERERLRETTGSLQEFIDGLALEIDVTRAHPADIPRIAQLSQRTNQFNTTTLRQSEKDVERWISGPGRHCIVTRVRDRFGDYGLVGLALATEEPPALRILGMLLSCRALARGVEHRMLTALGALAQERGLGTILIDYVQSERNEPARRFLETLAVADRLTTSGGIVFLLSSAEAEAIVFRPDDSPTAPIPRPGSRIRTPRAVWPACPVIEEVARERGRIDRLLATIDRSVRPRPALDQSFIPPRGHLEELIAELWREVLRISEVGATDLFSDLGGQSIHLVRIHGLLWERLGVDIDITTLFQFPTIRELAKALASRDDSRVGRVSDRAARQRQALSGLDAAGRSRHRVLKPRENRVV